MSVWALVAAALAGLLVVWALVRRHRWTRETDAWVARVVSVSSRPSSPAPVSRRPAGEEPGHELPALVDRYLSSVIPEGAVATASSVRIEHDGGFHLGEGRGWRPFRSWQVFDLRAPGFVWVARIRMAPGLDVHVRDAYAGGTAAMEARLQGVLPVMRATDGPELGQAALQRCLAEWVWVPVAFTAAGPVGWRTLDERRAEATLVDDGVTAVLTFRFDDAGLPVGVSSEARFREIGGSYVPTPWEGRFSDYRTYHGIRIPAEGEVAWIVDGERRPYWRGRIRSVTASVGE